MRVYLAGPYAEMWKLREWRKLLIQAGHICTAQWLDGDPSQPWGPATHAQVDLDDVASSDAVISIILPPTMPVVRGSRHVEFGYGLALGKIMIIVGDEPENIFHQLPTVRLCCSISYAILQLNAMDKAARDPILVEREKTHGKFAKNAEVWQRMVLEASKTQFCNDSQRLAVEMIFLKIARLLQNPKVQDHWDDIAGYAKLGSEACE